MDPFEKTWEDDVTTLVKLDYPPSLPHDMAMCMSDEEVEIVRQKYGYSESEFDYITNMHLFKREYAEWQQRLISEGNSFKLKLRAMSEAFLPNLHDILNSDTTAPSVKVDAFKYITKVAELEPTKASLEGASNDTGQKIVINIAPYAAAPTFTPQTIDITPKRSSSDE